uniref:Succinylglutamate desuccinylase/Aspartoacylase catalytic domain-containing protein n=1 Tax=candidate division WOR-3 bacterium TaxID=2052148 RepID=A0A7C4YDG9_UNCW3
MTEKDFNIQKFSFLKIMTSSDLSVRKLPLMEIRSRNEGPVLWLTACSHGEEIGGVVVIQEVFKKLKKYPLKKGRIFAFPLMNPMGFETLSRNITISEEDLNRAFPGNPEGTLAERIAHKIFSTIIETNPDLVIDLHNDWINSIPYTLIDPRSENIQENIYEIVKNYANLTGFVKVIDTELLKKSLSYNLLLNGIPSLTLELGQSYIVDEKNVDLGVNSIFNILKALEMIDYNEEMKLFNSYRPDLQDNLWLKYSNKPLCSKSGIIRFLIKPGDRIQKGKVFARVFNAFGKIQETLVSQYEGIILGHSDSSVVFPGMQVISIGVIE